jgi:hypothetical protein
VQQIFSLSCLPGSDGLPYCTAAADAVEAGGPVVIGSVHVTVVTAGGSTAAGVASTYGY